MSHPPKLIRLNLRINPKDLRTAQHKGVRVINIGGRAVAKHYVTKPVRKSMDLIVRNLKLHCDTFENPDKDHAWLYRVVYVYKPLSLPAAMRGSLKVTSPDGDNLTKSLLDSITESHIAWADDAQAHCAGEYRRYATKDEAAHIQLTLRRLDSAAFTEDIEDDE